MFGHYAKSGAHLWGIGCDLGHGQIFDILIRLSMETKSTGSVSLFTHVACYALNIISNTNILSLL